MGKIIILDENTVNKIAAGEVAERPASVIKELVENSIDAGSSNISIEIRNGGISYIRVIDNGSGLSEDDAEMAFERHATSKIRRADDLCSITSMGFRGEALASIAAVSKVQMLTRVRDCVQGISITVQGGIINEIRPAGCPAGTSITVKELFYNTPARYKFLKKDTTEAGYITDILSRIALSHPDISFSLFNNGKQILRTPGNNDLKSTVFSIYGADTAKYLMEVDYTDNNAIITGFAGKAEIARSNRAHQSIYVNKRYVRNKTITSAIDAAYTTFLMKNRYPFVLLDININPSNVDINVHPSKMEVKFSNEQDIFRAVYHAVNNALLSRSAIRTLPDTYERGSSSTFSDNGEVHSHTNDSKRQFIEKPAGRISYSQQEFEWVKKGLDQIREAAIAGEIQPTSPAEQKADPRCQESKGTVSDVSELQSYMTGAEKNENFTADSGKNKGEPVSQSEKNIVSQDISSQSTSLKSVKFENTTIIGQLFSTYVLLEGDEELFLLDQHAAHERIRYEELRKAYNKNEPFSQMLLSVIHIELTSSEYQFAMGDTEFFEKFGFSFEGFGTNSIILRSAPFVEGDIDIKACFLEILDFVMNGNKGEKNLIADEVLYTMACKSAVKAHKRLDNKEIEALLKKLSYLENPYTCPHGRPVIFKLRRYDLEKLFKRIV